MKLRFGWFQKVVFLSGIICFLSINNVFAQVAISPTTVFIAKSNHFGSFNIQNTSNKKQEVSIRFKFGYATTDSIGNLSMNYSDSVKAREYSINNWTHAFPKSLP